jgi:aminoglycoside phosphotransferase (APT) family kinase protein
MTLSSGTPGPTRATAGATAHMGTPGLDVRRFDGWLRTARPDLAGPGPLTASLLTGGKSNLTYAIDGGTEPMALRRPPLGHVQATAHDMAREFRVISALAGTAVPVPRALALHDDADGAAGTGTRFFLMSRVPGRALARPEQNAGYAPSELRSISLQLARALARLHRIDPAAVGLEDFGRPEGYLARQVRRWGTQYDGSRSRDLPMLDRLQQLLRQRVPATARSGLVHGDFRLDNALVATPVRPGGDQATMGDHANVGDHAAAAPDDPAPARITAILDWEMSTLGDTAVDLGLLWLYWEINALAPLSPVSAVDPAAGYPPFDELLHTYEEELAVNVPDLAWYRALAAYKLAVILEGVYFRHRAGETVGPGFDSIGDLAEPLAADGLEHLSRRARS